MKKFKKVVALVLAIAMVLSLQGPFQGALSAQAAEDGDGLTGWLIGGGSTMSGNPLDGWQLTLGNGNNYGSEVASYSNGTIDLSKLQVNFDLSETTGGFMIGLGDTLSGFPAENMNVLNFYFTKNVEGTWNVETYKGGGSFNKIANLDLTGSHAFGFMKIGSGWVLSIDGQKVGKIDTDEDFGSTGAYGDLNNSVQAEQARVTFVQFGAPVTIKGIHFTENKNDLSGWTLGATSKMSGNPAEGWQLDFSGDSAQVNGTSYEAYMNASKIQVKFNLSNFTGKTFFQLGNQKESFWTGTDTIRNFVFEKINSSTLRFYGYDTKIEGELVNSIDIENFDFEKDHVFEFMQENGTWKPALDGVIRCFDQWEDYFDTFVRNMMKQSAEKTTVSFAPNNSETSIKNINFSEKPAILLETSAALAGTIDYNFYMGLSKELAARDDVSMEFSFGTGTSAHTQRVNKADASYEEATGTYKFTCKLPAKHMADEITAQLYVGSEAIGEAYKSSVRAYAKDLLADPSLESKTKTLVENMLHYGAYAQKYFEYNTGDLADAGLDELNLTGITKDSFATNGLNVKADGFGSIAGANLHLDSTTDLRLYVKLSDGIAKDKVVFKCGDSTLETQSSGEYFIVIIPNIAAHELNIIFDVTAEVEGNTTSYQLQYSVYRYAYNVFKNGKESLKDLMKAMYLYNEAACEVRSN